MRALFVAVLAACLPTQTARIPLSPYRPTSITVESCVTDDDLYAAAVTELLAAGMTLAQVENSTLSSVRIVVTRYELVGKEAPGLGEPSEPESRLRTAENRPSPLKQKTGVTMIPYHHRMRITPEQGLLTVDVDCPDCDAYERDGDWTDLAQRLGGVIVARATERAHRRADRAGGGCPAARP